MRRARLVVLAIAAMGTISVAAFANVGPPPDFVRDRPAPVPAPQPPPRIEARLVIVPTPGAKEARLMIPQNLLDAKAAKDAAKPDGKKADAGLSPARTVVAGVALFAAISLAGMQLIRRRGGSRLMLVALLLAGGGVAAIASNAFGNAAPIPRPKPPLPEPPPALVAPGVPLIVEYGGNGDTLQLSIDPALVLVGDLPATARPFIGGAPVAPEAGPKRAPNPPTPGPANAPSDAPPAVPPAVPPRP